MLSSILFSFFFSGAGDGYFVMDVALGQGEPISESDIVGTRWSSLFLWFRLNYISGLPIPLQNKAK